MNTQRIYARTRRLRRLDDTNSVSGESATGLNNRRSRRRTNGVRRKLGADHLNTPRVTTFRLPSQCDAFTLLSGILNSIADQVHSDGNT
ncbi:hypothetical protein FHW16_002004 [Phyllobacterium myrsinacearum]|uniref:Uncharacterized protein n=1 Tax=Phyllobacterium myrsinacearum TaxID=28101 RepID=A0A839EHC6_9HYPH|nr:hypothetical protein [Phyllobacterium myrsinacearum]